MGKVLALSALGSVRLVYANLNSPLKRGWAASSWSPGSFSVDYSDAAIMLLIHNFRFEELTSETTPILGSLGVFGVSRVFELSCCFTYVTLVTSLNKVTRGHVSPAALALSPLGSWGSWRSPEQPWTLLQLKILCLIAGCYFPQTSIVLLRICHNQCLSF